MNNLITQGLLFARLILISRRSLGACMTLSKHNPIWQDGLFVSIDPMRVSEESCVYTR